MTEFIDLLAQQGAPFNPISAAEKKQDEVPNEYLDHIATRDEYTHPRNAREDRDAQGPLQNKFENLGLVVKGLVVGLFGETSPRVTEFIDFLAQQGAAIHLQAAVTWSKKVARAQLKAIMTRRLGMVVARGRAQQTISIMAKYPQALHLFGTFSEVLHGVPSKALRNDIGNEVDGTHNMEALNARPTPAYTGGPSSGSRGG